MESEFHTHEQQLHISILLLMQNITRLAAAQAFLCDEAPLSGKYVVECSHVWTDCDWKTARPLGLLVLKQFLFLSRDFPRPFVQQVGGAGSLSKT